MSKRSSRGRAGRPAIPRVSPDSWKRLLEAADDFNRLAPWRWMRDSQLTGLRHPETGEALLGSILGRMRSIFALVLYRNAGGHRWVLNTILENNDSGEWDDSAFEQDALKVEFVRKSELEDEDRAILAAANYKPSLEGARAWPQFRSVMPAACPWHLTQSEAETLLFALPRVAALARLSREKTDLWDDHVIGEIPFLPDAFDPANDQLRAEQIDWRPMLPPPEPPLEAASLDEETIARLRQLQRVKGFHLEVDVTYAPMAVGGAGLDRPRFPRLSMAVDRASGFVGGFHLSDRDDPEGAVGVATVVRDTLERLGSRPEVICVQRPRVATMLSKIAGRLETPVVVDEELEQLNAAKASMLAFFRRR